MLESPEQLGWRYWLRAGVPQMLTGSRAALGAASMITALNGRLYLAAVLITLGAVTDLLDGFIARRLGVASAFGALFDTFTDYLCFVVAPWFLTRALVAADQSLIHELLLGSPLVMGAMRYARNSLLIVNQSQEVRELPGLATVFFAFLPVVAVFLDARSLIGLPQLSAGLTFFVVCFSLLMVAPVRYPKLSRFRGMTAVTSVLLVVMPFLGTRALAAVMLVVGLLYVALAHTLTHERTRFAASPNAERAGIGDPPRLPQ
jgi:CDP-diacylglycerol---serine O-phosphatidyltransferase